MRGEQLDDRVIEETGHSTIERDTSHGSATIIKRAKLPHDLRTSTRWRKEVAALKAIGDHGNITRLLKYSEPELTISLHLEAGKHLGLYVDSDHISTLQEEDGHMIWRQMSNALAHLHSIPMIHDDVKPDNIMYCDINKRAVLIDLGAAIISTASATAEDNFTSLGTPSYAAPEYLRRQKSDKTDVWGLGVTMLFVLGYVRLPDGKWLLPEALEDHESQARTEMVNWLEVVERLRVMLVGKQMSLARMLESDSQDRIGAAELVLELS